MLKSIIEKIDSNERIDQNDAFQLFQHADLISLGQLANQKRLKMHPEPVVTYVVDRNINYTNVCMSGCLFCAYFKPLGHEQAFVISKEALQEKIRETLELGGTQILLQGGMNPELDLDYYVDLLQFIKSGFKIHIHGFSPPEIAYLSQKSNKSIKDIIRILNKAGLDSIPGGGAEILSDDIRQKISPNKCNSATWLSVMQTAHELGLKTTATMMFGHIENFDHICSHLTKIRQLQDQTNGFTAFIPWTFQPTNTRISVNVASSVHYLKILAISRLFLDNIPNIQASWVTQGDKIAQLALFFGANDLGSTMIEENVVAAAGVHFKLPKNDMIGIIESAGFKAVQRNCFYELLN